MRSAANRCSTVRGGRAPVGLAGAAAAHAMPRCATASPTPSVRRQTTVSVVSSSPTQTSATASATPSSLAESLASAIKVSETNMFVAGGDATRLTAMIEAVVEPNASNYLVGPGFDPDPTQHPSVHELPPIAESGEELRKFIDTQLLSTKLRTSRETGHQRRFRSKGVV